jgi:amino acid adenylation domain-containing protein
MSLAEEYAQSRVSDTLSLNRATVAMSPISGIAEHAVLRPAAVAIHSASGDLTFAELDHRSGRWAELLSSTGIGAGSLVALYVDRSPRFVVAALAVLKTGAAYLPIDPATPADRVRYILADSAADLVLTGGPSAAPPADPPCPVVDLDGLPGDGPARAPVAGGNTPLAGGDGPVPGVNTPLAGGDTPVAGGVAEPSPDELAYVIYTSGSTGRPKGVEITHGNLRNLVEWHVTAFGVTAGDRAGQVAGVGFDAAVWELWPHLTAGCPVHIADEATRRSPVALREWLVDQGITIAFVPTVLAEQLLHSAWPERTALRYLLTGADTLHSRPPAGLPFALVNNYGPTECTVVATSGVVAAARDGDGWRPSIGRPIRNATALVLDAELRPVPRGTPGELCLAGRLVGRGYRNDPELTARAFVPVALGSAPPVRMYRTGDRVRMLDGGELEYLGRLDDQIKIRGFRIEPGEISTWLNRYPGVTASVVVARELDGGPAARTGTAGAGEKHLVGYVVAAPDTRPDPAALAEHLGRHLPEYMVPSAFVVVGALPMTPNGKVDRSRLPAPPITGPATPSTGPAAAGAARDPGRAELEQRVGALVAALLKRPAVGVDENFFLLGGHSMLGVQLVSRLRQELGVVLALRQLFGAPTVAALSAEIRKRQPGGEPA